MAKQGIWPPDNSKIRFLEICSPIPTQAFEDAVNDYASINWEDGSGESHSDSQMGHHHDEMADWVSNQRETIGFANCQVYKALAACKLSRSCRSRVGGHR